MRGAQLDREARQRVVGLEGVGQQVLGGRREVRALVGELELLERAVGAQRARERLDAARADGVRLDVEDGERAVRQQHLAQQHRQPVAHKGVGEAERVVPAAPRKGAEHRATLLVVGAPPHHVAREHVRALRQPRGLVRVAEQAGLVGADPRRLLHPVDRPLDRRRCARPAAAASAARRGTRTAATREVAVDGASDDLDALLERVGHAGVDVPLQLVAVDALARHARAPLVVDRRRRRAEHLAPHLRVLGVAHGERREPL